MRSASYFCSFLLPVSFVTYSMRSHGHLSSHTRHGISTNHGISPNHGETRDSAKCRDCPFHVNRFKRNHDPMVYGVKSKIRKKTAGNSSSCPEYARANFQNPSEDQAILMGRHQTIGGIYWLFRKYSGGADGGVSAVPKVPLGHQCNGLDNLKVFALQVNGCEFIDSGAGGHGIRSIILPGWVQAGATPILLEKCTSRTCGGSSLREDVPPVGVVDQNRQKSDRLADLLPLSTAVSEGLQSEWGGG